MFNITQFRNDIITPVLSELHLYSKVAEELLVLTCAVESDGGTFVRQVKGPALGVYQCEPATHSDLWRNYIINRNNFISILALNFGVNIIPNESKLISDLRYATAICRLHYARIKEALPSSEQDTDAIWEYYKKYYNTALGKSTKTKSITAYKRFCQNT